MKQRFTAPANIVNELEEAQVPGQFLLRNATMRSQPGTKQGPEPFQGVDMSFTKTIPIFISPKTS
jgi:hypothetical protein